MAISKFYHGSAAFKCNVCGRGTRETGRQSGNKTCPQCFDLAGIQNEISDGHRTLVDAQPVLRALFVISVEAAGAVIVKEWVA